MIDVPKLIELLLSGGAGAIILAVVQAIKTRADSRRADRAEDASDTKVIVGAAADVVEMQRTQIEKLSQRITELESRVARSESRAANSETHEHRLRQEIIKLGERLSKERIESQKKINQLIVIIEQLFEQVKTLTGSEPTDVDLKALKSLLMVI